MNNKIQNYYKKQWDILVKSAKMEYLPHALLFWGEEGIGKKEFAVNFVSSIIKENPGHPDFILLEPKKIDSIKSSEKALIQISQIREIIEKLSFKPYSSDRKFAIIDRAHLMAKDAQNCFLKFLEEPGEKTHLILLTEYPNLFLPTILSRVQKIRFYSDIEIQEDSETVLELLKVSKQDLGSRFNFAKSLAEKDSCKVLDIWLKYFRKILFLKIKGTKEENFESYSILKIKDIISQIQVTKTLISSTNVNPKLTLEVLLMNL